SSRRRHTRFKCDWSSDVCSSDLTKLQSRLRAVQARDALNTFTLDISDDGEPSLAEMLAAPEAPVVRGRVSVLGPQPAPPCPDAQIGRASCRERARTRGGAV